MTLWADLQAARATVADLERQLAAAQARVADLAARAVAGGPDVSEFQGDVNWSAVRGAGYDLAICRLSDGDRPDTRMSRARADSVRGAGMVLGTYHFARVGNAANGNRPGRIEAAMVVWRAWSMGVLAPGDLPLAYDVETANGEPMEKAAGHFAEFVRAYHYLTRHYPILYGPPAFLGQVASASDSAARTVLGRCPLWIAHWGVDTPTVPPPWTEWVLWQHTDKATMPGITGGVDANRFGGDRAALDNLRIAPQ